MAARLARAQWADEGLLLRSLSPGVLPGRPFFQADVSAASHKALEYGSFLPALSRVLRGGRRRRFLLEKVLFRGRRFCAFHPLHRFRIGDALMEDAGEHALEALTEIVEIPEGELGLVELALGKNSLDDFIDMRLEARRRGIS